MVAIVIGVGCLLAALLVITAPELQPQSTARPLPSVRVIVAAQRDLPLTVRSQGAVQPRTEADLVPQVSGRVVWLSQSMYSGGHFTEGDELLRIDDSDYRTGVGSAEAAVMRARAEAEFTRFESERLGTLQSRDLASRSQAENALRARRVAESGLKEAEVALERARLDLARTVIRAPFTGRVRSERVDVGQALNRGETIGSVYATDDMEVRLPVPDAQLAYLESALLMGATPDAQSAPAVRLSADFGGRAWSWEGRIVRTEGEIDPTSRMVHVVARVATPEGPDAAPLPVGLFVQAEIQGKLAHAVILLPRAALRDGNRVLVVDGDDRLRFREVELLRTDRDSILVRAGIEPGERVCVSPMQIVVEGMQVVPVEEDGS